jgi:hypothetical protein
MHISPKVQRNCHHLIGCLCLWWCIICLPICVLIVSARANGDPIKAFLAVNGCVIGPSTIESAVEQKIDRQVFEAYVSAVRSQPRTVQTGEWLVLPPDACTILLPVVVSEGKITDPEVIGSLSDINAYAKDGDIGCFLDPDKLTKTLMVTRLWSFEKVQQEYVRFLGASVIAGDLSFYSTDPLRTPPGFIATSGPCASTPDLPDIKRNHRLLVEHFGAMLRADAAGEAFCEMGSAPSWKLPEIIKKITANQSSNAWMFFEVKLIALSAGWYEGTSSSNQGSPRPPLCRYKTIAQ